MVPIDWLCGSVFKMHWLGGVSEQIKPGLPGVCANLQRKCGQSWLHSCWFSFTRAYTYRKGNLKSPLILWVNWAFFLESKYFVSPEGSDEEGWGQEGPIAARVFCADGSWTGKAETSSHLQHRSVPSWWGALSDGLCRSSALFSSPLDRRFGHHLISRPRCYSSSYKPAQ